MPKPVRLAFILCAAAALCKTHPVGATDNNRSVLRREYTDGEGQYVNSDSVHHYASGVKCWTDYYVVSQDVEYGEWYPASDKVYCTNTNQCRVDKMTGQQNCQTTTIEMSAGIEADFLNIGISAGYQVQKCSSAQDTSSCTWTDDQCHIIWAQQQYLSQKGYSRRRCHDKGQDYTAWMKDFENKAPTNSLNYGCGSKCSDSP